MSNGEQPLPPTPPENDPPISQVRLDYAWKNFEGASKQRMTMFNFYLIMTGILANALVLTYKEGYGALVCNRSLAAWPECDESTQQTP